MRKKTLTASLIALIVSLVAVTLWHVGVLARLESASWDMRVRMSAKPSAYTPEIKIILLDQASLDWGSESFQWSWPWPREVYAPLIDFVRRGGAKAIAFDVLFLEPSAYGVLDDAAFGQAIGAGRDVVGAVFLGQSTGNRDRWPDGYARLGSILTNAAPWRRGSGPDEAPATRMAAPIPEMGTNVAALGNVKDDPDKDGTFRRASLLKYLGDEPVLSLGAAMYALTHAQHLTSGDFTHREDGSPTGFKIVPHSPDMRAVLRFRGPSQTHETFNAAAIIRSELGLREGETNVPVDPAVFKDAYVFFGFSAPGLMDLRPTPIGKVYPGVEIHATVLDNLLAKDFIRAADTRVFAIGVFIFCFGVTLLMLLCGRAWQSVLLFALALPIPTALGFMAYTAGVWWPIVPQSLATLVALIAATVVNYATEGRQKAFIKRAFKHYLSPDVIDQIIKNPGSLELGGERRELTIFFSDLQGFSSISEHLDPVQLTALLNGYLTEMTDIIHAEGGTLDKFEGDAIIAFWNAPLDQADHARRACHAAVRCQRRLSELREEYRVRFGSELYMRIGLNTGPVVVGNMGSRERFDYTVLGDAANLASRLEGANKLFGTWSLVSEETWRNAQPEVAGRFLGGLRVVGRSAPVRVYELTGTHAGESPPGDAFNVAMDALQSGEIAKALSHFEACPDDPVARAYARRCRELVESGQPWDGVWNLTEK